MSAMLVFAGAGVHGRCLGGGEQISGPVFSLPPPENGLVMRCDGTGPVCDSVRLLIVAFQPRMNPTLTDRDVA